ncbi:MAG TPA: DUF3592 domain-containing protein [Desulfuromonadales bacterium]|nr:DUF3592 domain-containing protein [Desulfuromonadales bacterium]
MHELIRNAAWVLSFLIGGLWVTIGLLFAGIGWSTLRMWFVSARWPQVPARIVASEIKAGRHLDDHLMYQPVVRYAFAAGGQEVGGDQLTFVGKLYASEARARRDIEKYPVGMIVMAHCHPQDPVEVILERSGALTGFFLLLLGLGLAAAPLAMAGWFGIPVWPLVAIVGTVAAFAALLDRSSRRRLLQARLAGLYPAKGQGRDGDVERLLHQGEKLLAIRLYRELHETDLKTARRRVEELQQKPDAV